MAKPTRQFKKPAKPLSYKDVVKKILNDADFAQFFYGEVVKARMGDKAAEKIIAGHFKLQPGELKELKLTTKVARCACTDITQLSNFCLDITKYYLFEFATPVHVWSKKRKKD
jgi:hypothetical protein